MDANGDRKAFKEKMQLHLIQSKSTLCKSAKKQQKEMGQYTNNSANLQVNPPSGRIIIHSNPFSYFFFFFFFFRTTSPDAYRNID